MASAAFVLAVSDCVQPVFLAARTQARALDINNGLSLAFESQALRESFLEHTLERIENLSAAPQRIYWLLMARLLEAALVCAGEYADHAEYRAAGDLMLNPRQIRIHHCDGTWQIKDRYARLSDVCNPEGLENPVFMHRFQREYSLQTVKPPLLPLLVQRLNNSSLISPAYLDNVQSRMKRIGSTMNFLNTWGLHGAEDLFRLQTTTSEERWHFVQKNLCRFSPDLFWSMGEMLNESICWGGDQGLEHTARASVAEA